MTKTTIKLTDIAVCLLPVITTTKNATIWLNGLKVKEIYIVRDNQYRINTDKGQYRYPIDTELELDICG